MKKVLSVLCALALMMGMLPVSATAETLADGMAPTDALALAAACAVMDGYEMDNSTIKSDGAKVSARVGIFTITVDAQNGVATGVTLGSGYLDSEYATSMGRIFGRMLSTLGAFEDAQVILESLDFNAFNTLEANTQTLVYGDYRVIIKVDPSNENCYQLAMQLRNVSTQTQPAPAQLTAGEILSRMAPELSASVVYTAETDPNQALGKEGKYQSKANFALKSIAPNHDGSASIEVEQGGSIEVFATALEAVNRGQYVAATKINYFGTTEYSFVCDKALLRLAPTVSAEEAGQLIASFMAAVESINNPAAAVVTTAEPEPAAESETMVSTADLLFTPIEEPAAIAVKEGDILELGSYEQDNVTSNGKEPIEWQVLVVDGNEALVLSKYALDVYNTYWGSPTWDNSTLRTWLNDTFLNEAFTAEEQQAVIEHIVPADPNPNYTSDPGADTEDKVFCLSYIEAENLLTASQRKAVTTQYAKKTRGVYTEGDYCYWWLRSPGKPGSGAAIACTDGSFDYDLSYDGFSYGVRPAIWVSLDKLPQ